MGDKDTPRSRLLRAANSRALARLRWEYDERYQQLVDEEVERLGGTPRAAHRSLPPRRTWGPEAKQKGTTDD